MMASVQAGRTRWCATSSAYAHPVAPEAMSYIPEAGRIGHTDANNSNNMSPDQNTGAENPNSATIVTSAPRQLDGLLAAVTPRNVPTMTAVNSAEKTSSTVAN